MNILKILLLFTLACGAGLLNTCYLMLATPIFAHNVKSENKIGAVLHIDPGDQPKAGEQSTIILEFKDIESIFSLEGCSCKLDIYADSNQIFETELKPLSDSAKLVSGTNFTFPKAGNYRLKVSGAPKKEDSFEEFEFSYQTVVGEEPQPTSSPGETISPAGKWISEHVVHLAGAFLVLGFLIFALTKQSRDKKT